MQNSQESASTKASFAAALKEFAPTGDLAAWSPFLSDELIACEPVDLPSSLWEDAAAAIRDFFAARNRALADSSLGPAHNWTAPGNASICMSYDFHWSPEKGLRLIEINTNAAFLFLSLPLYRSFGLATRLGFDESNLKAMIEKEMALFSQDKRSVQKVAIVDESPKDQKLYLEFLFTQALMGKWGWRAEIRDVNEVTEDFDFIYNRSTDFQFRQPQSAKLLELYLAHKSCISPHPLEYLLLADKERLTSWSQNPEGLGMAARKVLLPSRVLTEENRDQMWRDRKGLFFKPLRSFGGKMSYKGESMSRKAFELLPAQETLAQEYIAAPVVKTSAGDFKYDLRFYAYEDQLQNVVARLYQGQLTNLKTLGGGFAPIRWVNG